MRSTSSYALAVNEAHAGSLGPADEWCCLPWRALALVDVIANACETIAGMRADAATRAPISALRRDCSPGLTTFGS